MNTRPDSSRPPAPASQAATGFEVVATRWLEPDDDLLDVLVEYLPQLGRRDVVVVSEKVAVLLTGRAVPIGSYRAGRLARLLVRFVRPPAGSRGLSVPAKMQYVVREIGLVRTLLAAAVSAVTRPFGVTGAFYRIAGPVARDLDGGRPPYEHLLLPPLTPAEAAGLCAAIERRIVASAAIVDLNDFGGRVRATSPSCPDAEWLLALIGRNPLGQRLTGTPFGVLRMTPDPSPPRTGG